MSGMLSPFAGTQLRKGATVYVRLPTGPPANKTGIASAVAGAGRLALHGWSRKNSV